MTTKTVYHYSNNQFNEFNTEISDGLWFTDIEPSNIEMFNEIGVDAKYCAICAISYENELYNGKNCDVEEQLLNEECDVMINKYDGFTDYAVVNTDQVKIIKWIEL